VGGGGGMQNHFISFHVLQAQVLNLVSPVVASREIL